MIKLAIFDVDGTLFEGNLGIDYIKKLIKESHFSPEIGAGIFAWFDKYKSGEIEKSIAVDEIYRLYSEGMKGKFQTEMSDLGEKTLLDVEENIYPFTKELIQKVAEKGYIVLLISGSPIEMIIPFAKMLSITEYIAGTLEVESGKYTGNIISYPGSSEQKIMELEKYLKQKNLEVDFKNSIAMGDNERDFGILNMVGKGIAFEPNEALKLLSVKHNLISADRNNLMNLVLKIS